MHANPLKCRNRPTTKEYTRLAEGIAQSFRQFSIAASRCAESEDQSRPSRVQRSASALNEVSSFSNAPSASRGIDARSLAAKPTQGFAVRRVDLGSFRGGSRDGAARGGSFRVGGGYQRNREGNGGMSGQVSRGSFRGGEGRAPRGGSRGGGFRGPSRGSGGPGRSTNREGRTKGQQQQQEEDPILKALGISTIQKPADKNKKDNERRKPTEEELAFTDGMRMGFPTAYIPTTTQESLKIHALPLATSSSPMGITESLVRKMQIATGLRGGNFPVHPRQHLYNMERGKGTVFESKEVRDMAEKLKGKIGREVAEVRGVEFKEDGIKGLEGEEKEEVLGEIVGGRYEEPMFTERGDVFGQVKSALLRNGTYLPGDARKLEGKLRALLPAQFQGGQQKAVA